jgi:creatinine amidohydrolase
MAEIEWARLRAAELRRLAEADAAVIVPVASLEQHGPHLPVQIDTLLCTAVAHRAARRAAERRPVVVLPPVWTGLSEHHMAFGGTITLDFATFHALLRGICLSLRRHGFRRILLLNGHGGNVAALKVVVEELTRELGLGVSAVTYWHHAAEAFRRILERQDNVRHACEAETSMAMALIPDLVDRTKLKEARGPEESVREPEVEGLYRARPFTERTPNGVIGDPTAASAEKGERLLEAAAAALAAELMRPEFGVWSS